MPKGKPKKVKSTKPSGPVLVTQEITEKPTAMISKELLTPLSIDYPNEGLNDMARKINQLIEVHNAL